MVALEFSGTIEQGGVIHLPREYAEYDNAQVRIIVLVEKAIEASSQKEQLIALFTKMQQLPMFSNIDDPTAWQKQIRDEWD
jgi:hypothetical protein